MDDFEQSDLEKEVIDSRNTFYQNAIQYEKRKHCHKKITSEVYFLLSLL